MLNAPLRQMLGRRRMTVELLAVQIFSNASALSQTINGRKLGKVTWRKLERVLTKAEYDCAKDFAWKNLADAWARENGIESSEIVLTYLNTHERLPECAEALQAPI